MRQQSLTILVLVAALTSCDRTGEANATKLPAQSDTASPVRQQAAAPAMLTFDSIPQAARAVLAAQAPDFVPWSSGNYPQTLRDSVPPTGDEGLSVVRGRFRSPTNVDYVIAGYDRRLRGLRIVAVLAESDGSYKMIGVSDGPERPDSVATRPDRYLRIAKNDTGAVDFIVFPNAGASPLAGDRWRWVPKRNAFLLVEPG